MKLKTSVCDYSARNYVIRKHRSCTCSKKNDKNVVFKNSAPLTDCISEINIDNGKDNDVVMPRYNVTQYSDNYSKTF